MILVRSPYILEIPFTSAERFIVQVFIWNGVKSSVPIAPNYEIENKNPLSRTGNANVNISSYVKDFLTINKMVDSTTNAVSSDCQVWVKSQVIYYNSGVASEPSLVQTNLASYGYGYGNEGKNTTIPTSNALTSVNDTRVSKNSFVNVPIKISESTTVVVTVKSYPNETLNKTFTLSSTNVSSALVKNVFIKTSEATNEKYIEVKRDGVLVKTFKIVDEPRYTPIDLWFINKFGQLDTMTMFKEKTTSMSVESENYETSIGQPLDGVHQFQTFKTNAKEDFKIKSGFLNEENNELVKQLLLSESIWIYNGVYFNPINLKGKSIEYQTRQKERLLNYELSFEYAYSTINNI